MEKVTKFDLADYYNLPNPGLLAYFKHTVAGSNVDIRPPFWEGKSREEVVSLWTDVLDGSGVDSIVPGLLAYEEEMRKKIGPLSIQLPLAERVEKIEEYYKDILLKSVPIDPRAIKSFLMTVRPIKAQRRGIEHTLRKMRLNTNSGSPEFTKRNKVCSLADIKRQLEWAKRAATLGWRGQEGGPEPDDVKQRVLFMFPFVDNLEELRFYQPLIELWQRYHINSAYENMRAVEVKLTRLFDTKGDEYVVVTDFTGFDQHFNTDLQEAAKECLRYQIFNGEEWLDSVFPIKYNIPLICSPSLMYTGHHGMGSGSGGTNFDECNAHSCMQHEAAILKGKTLNPYSNAYGDDGYLSYPGIDVDDVISTYSSHGQVMNPSKQSVDKHSAVYLRRYFHDSYRDKQGIMLGVYSTYRALGRLLGQERMIPFEEDSGDYRRYVILRALSILENCNNSPIFEEFVDFVISGDKYRLGLGLPGFLESLDRQVRELTEMDPDLLGYTKTLQNAGSGINNWRVVKYLRSKQ
nr:RNA-dependent RNA polymerase [Marmot picobirnavirus]